MKRFALAIALACVLSGSALGGDSHSTGSPTPGEIPTVPVTCGDIPTDNSTAPGDITSVGMSLVTTLLDLAF